MNDKYLEHHGVKGQKWGIRRYQDSNGNLTSEGKKHYGITDNDINIAKKYVSLLDKNCYKIPNSKNKEDLISIIKYDRSRGNNTSRYFNDFNNKTVNLIYHYTKNGKIALSYARVPGFGDIYVKGTEDFNDDDLKEWFKKSPNKDEILYNDFVDKDYLEHFGVKGQKWGIRNDDGTLTNKGKRYRHYAKTAGVFLSAGTGYLLLRKSITNKFVSTKYVGRTISNALLSAGLAATLYDAIKNPEK